MKNQYWACSHCDAGGNPLTRKQALAGAERHQNTAGHLTVWGTIVEPVKPVNTPEELAAGAECVAAYNAYAAKVLAGAVDAPAYLKDPHHD